MKKKLLHVLLVLSATHVSAATWFNLAKFDSMREMYFSSGRCDENYDFLFFEGMCYYRIPPEDEVTLIGREETCSSRNLGEAFILVDTDGNVKKNVFDFLKTHFMTQGAMNTYTGIDLNRDTNTFVVSKDGYATPKLDGYYSWTLPTKSGSSLPLAFGRPGGEGKGKWDLEIDRIAKTGLHPWSSDLDNSAASAENRVGEQGNEKPLYTLCVKRADEVRRPIQSRPCNVGQYLFRSTCYSMHVPKLRPGFIQSDAVKECENRRGKLAEPRTSAEMHFLFALANYSGYDFDGSYFGPWLGMYDPDDAEANQRLIYLSDDTTITPSSPAWKFLIPNEPSNAAETRVHLAIGLPLRDPENRYIGLNDALPLSLFPAVCEFSVDPSEEQCSDLISQHALKCPCGMMWDEGRSTCTSNLLFSRLDEVSILLSCAKKAFESSHEASGEYMIRAIDCMKPTEIFTFGSVKDVDWRATLWIKLEALLDKMLANGQVDIPNADVIKTGLGKYHGTYLNIAEIDSALCVVPLPCGKKLSNWKDLTSDFVTVDSPLEALVIARAQALCEVDDIGRTPSNKQSLVAPGSFLLHATICAASMRHAGKDSIVPTIDMTETVLNDIAAIAQQMLTKEGSAGDTVLFAVMRFVHSMRFESGVLPDRNKIPWFSMQFVQKAGDETSQSLESAGKQLAAFNLKLKNLQQDEAIMQRIDEGNDAVIETVLGFFTETKRKEYENIISDIEGAKGAIEIELEKTRLKAAETEDTMKKSLEHMELAYTALTGQDLKDKDSTPRGGQLERLQNATEVLLKADGNLEQAKQIRAQRNAIFNLITSTISLAASAIGIGGAVAAAAKQVKRIGLRKMFNKAVDSAKQDPVGTIEDGLGVLSTALELANGDLEALPIVGDIMAIESSIQTLLHHEDEMKRIREETGENIELLDKAMDSVGRLLRKLADRAVTVSIAALRATEWLEDDDLDISQTKIESELVESSQVWIMLQRDLVQNLIDLQICPDVDGKNPYRDSRRRLVPAVLEVPSQALTVQGSLRTRGLAHASSAAVQASNHFGRVLFGKGDEEVERARAEAAVAWDDVSLKCRDFNQVFDRFIIWAVESHNTLYQTVVIIREHVAVRASADSLQSGGWASAMTATVARLHAVKSSMDEEKYNKAYERALRSQFDVSLLSQALVLERIVVGAIRSVCAAVYYTFPTTDMPSIKVTSPSNLELEVSGADCDVRFRPLRMDALPTPLERLTLLEKAMVSSGPIDQVWIKAHLADRNNQRTVSDLSCDLSQMRLMDELFAKTGNRVTFDIRPNSFTTERTGSNCYPNAELRTFRVYFLNKDKTLVDTGDKFITVNIESSENSVFQKLKLKGGKAHELLFLGGKARSERFLYRGPEPSENCGSTFKLDRVPTSGQNVCTNSKDQDYERYFAATPIYGRWSISLPLGWPSDLPKPAQMLVVLGFVSASCDIQDVTKVIEFSDTRQGLSYADDYLQLGLTCGLKDFPSAALLSSSSPIPTETANVLSWAIPVAIVGVLTLVGAAFLVHRRVAHKQPNEMTVAKT